jgi:pimeloyl-ACP methyl ester carboxylesterase
MKNKIVRALKRGAALLLAGYLASLALLFGFQEKLLFHPGAPLDPAYSFRLSLPFEELRLELGDARVHSLLVKARNPRGLLLYFHGNAGNLANWGEVGEDLADRLGWSVLVVDYPGFGKSEGSIRSEAQLHEMAKAFLALAKEKAGGLPLALFGRSIGSGLATRLAAEHEVKALVLESPYLSMLSLATEMFPWVPGFVLRYPLRSDLAMGQVKAPVLILHGDQDELIPHASGLALSKLVENGRFVTIEGGRHNDLGGSEFYWAELKAFLRRF